MVPKHQSLYFITRSPVIRTQLEHFLAEPEIPFNEISVHHAEVAQDGVERMQLTVVPRVLR